MVSMSALAQQLRLQDQVRLLRLQDQVRLRDQVRLQDQAGKGHMRSRLTKAGTHSIPVFLFSGSNRSAINQAGIKLRPKGLLWVDGGPSCIVRKSAAVGGFRPFAGRAELTGSAGGGHSPTSADRPDQQPVVAVLITL